jgi:hypothetical protein
MGELNPNSMCFADTHQKPPDVRDMHFGEKSRNQTYTDEFPMFTHCSILSYPLIASLKLYLPNSENIGSTQV